jgi:hypothetical protein
VARLAIPAQLPPARQRHQLTDVQHHTRSSAAARDPTGAEVSLLTQSTDQRCETHAFQTNDQS